MASKLTSQTSCIDNSNEGNSEGVKVDAKGSYDKGRWDSWSHGVTWLDGSFVDETLFDIKCNSDTWGRKDSQNLWKREHAGSDWLSKEMVFQELVCSDRSTSWCDLYSSRNEHKADIMPALSAFASLLTDWCLLEKDITDSEKNSKFYWGCRKCGDFWDYNLNSSKEVDLLSSILVHSDCLGHFSFDQPLQKAWAEFHGNQHCQSSLSLREHGFDLGHSICLNACKEETCVCERKNLEDYLKSRLEKTAGMYVNCKQINSKCQEDEDDFVEAMIMKESILAAEDSLKDFINMKSQPIFRKQISAVSRFSFGRDDSEIFLADADFRENFEKSKGISTFYKIDDLMALDHNLAFCSKNIEHKENRLETQGYLSECCSKQLESVNVQADELIPEGLLYSLSYMKLHDLLKMEQVCRYLKNRVKNDTFLWQRLHVELPMSNNLTDEILLELASRSRGQLQSLSLVDCIKVTEAALEEIVLSNPRLMKLALPGCSRISADGIVRMVEGHMNQKPAGVATLKQLRVRNMDGFTKEHLDKLQRMVGVQAQEQSSTRKLQFYHQKHHISFQDDDRAIDVELCPKCTNVRLVYDCTRERCQRKRGVSECRACILCIVRCEACGRCITDNNYEETFALDVLCSYCWLGSGKCAECNKPDSGTCTNCSTRALETNFVCNERFLETGI